MQLTLHHAFPTPALDDADLYRLCQLVDEALGELPGIVNLVFCDDDQIRALNRDYRGKDQVTDVLTFPYFEGAPSEEDELLGEIFVCVSQAKFQCRQEDWEEAQFDGFSPEFLELIKLVIHGLYHLRGYDHIEDDDYRVMKLLEDETMKRFLESQKI